MNIKLETYNRIFKISNLLDIELEEPYLSVYNKLIFEFKDLVKYTGYNNGGEHTVYYLDKDGDYIIEQSLNTNTFWLNELLDINKYTKQDIFIIELSALYFLNIKSLYDDMPLIEPRINI